MQVGTLVNHKNYFGVGIVIDTKEVDGKTQWLIHWLTEGRTVGWSLVDAYLRHSVEVLCK